MLITCTKLPIGNLNINNYHISVLQRRINPKVVKYNVSLTKFC